ncbi:14862_t:CDS:1 [Funneliformis geosporum]|uniref:9723_t:CDS:1 n=1 Tax=Funneliformis geosporum TaxID=1117311 RepID=A0A9W4WS14_9GLOM|nr:14862_t:CDS:1 [Funneliformis geosporum]CAI2182463.1 9723_t:CDS:1 [Funneliformis geosporum]
MNMFMMFRTEMMNTRDPNITMTEFSKLVSKRWRVLPEQEKLKYQRNYHIIRDQSQNTDEFITSETDDNPPTDIDSIENGSCNEVINRENINNGLEDHILHDFVEFSNTVNESEPYICQDPSDFCNELNYYDNSIDNPDCLPDNYPSDPPISNNQSTFNVYYINGSFVFLTESGLDFI